MRIILNLLLLVVGLLGITLPVQEDASVLSKTPYLSNEALLSEWNIEQAAETSAGATCQQGEIDTMAEPQNTSTLLFDFESTETSGQWMIVNDGVMGGLSESNIFLSGNGSAIFTGTVSLENFGGFASIRTNTFASLDNSQALSLRVLGDGRTYKLRLRTNAYMDGPAYEGEFDTIAGEWIEVEIPYSEMQATFRGRLITDAPELTGESIKQIGIMIADKTAGQFRLEIDWIKTIAK